MAGESNRAHLLTAALPRCPHRVKILQWDYIRGQSQGREMHAFLGPWVCLLHLLESSSSGHHKLYLTTCSTAIINEDFPVNPFQNGSLSDLFPHLSLLTAVTRVTDVRDSVVVRLGMFLVLHRCSAYIYQVGNGCYGKYRT